MRGDAGGERDCGKREMRKRMGGGLGTELLDVRRDRQ